MGTVLLCARLGGMAVSAYRSQTRSVPAYRRPECLLKSRMCERHLSGSVRAWAATFGEHPVYSTAAPSDNEETDGLGKRVRICIGGFATVSDDSRHRPNSFT